MAVHDAKLHPDTQQLNPDIRIAIVAAEFNKGIMTDLIRLNINKLQEAGFVYVDLFRVPGAFEIPAQTSVVLESGLYSVVITLGCVIRGETPHFDYICTECSRAVMDLSLAYTEPVVFGLLTCDDKAQAEARVNDNYAIYALNYLAQRGKAEMMLEKKTSDLMKKAGEIMGE